MTYRQVILALSIVFLLYFSGLHFDLGVLVIRPADVLLSAMILVVLAEAVSSGSILTIRIKLGRVAVLLGVFVIYRFFNGLMQADFTIALKELVQSMLIVGFALLLKHFCHTVQHRDLIFKHIRGLLLTASLLLFFYFLLMGQPFGFKTFGPFKHLYALAALFVLDRFLTKPSPSISLLLASVMTIVVFSGEKKGWIALSFAAGYLIWEMYKRASARKKQYVRLSLASVVFVGVISIPILLPSTPYVVKQLNSLSEVAQMASSRIFQDPRVASIANRVSFSSRSNISRFYVLSTAMDQVQETPLFGIGPQNLKPLVMASSPFSWLDPGAHNDYLNTLVEYGAVGLLLQLLIISILFRYSVYLKKSTVDPATKQQITFIQALLLFGVVINGFFGGSDALNLLYLLVPMGLLFSIPNPHTGADNHANDKYASDCR
ncbi:MAG: O-antigen ligase family protein [Bacteroidota bacterium]